MKACRRCGIEADPDVGELQTALAKTCIELNTLRVAAKAVDHQNDCPAIERLQADRVTMAARGPCNCWLRELTEAINE